MKSTETWLATLSSSSSSLVVLPLQQAMLTPIYVTPLPFPRATSCSPPPPPCRLRSLPESLSSGLGHCNQRQALIAPSSSSIEPRHSPFCPFLPPTYTQPHIHQWQSGGSALWLEMDNFNCILIKITVLSLSYHLCPPPSTTSAFSALYVLCRHIISFLVGVGGRDKKTRTFPTSQCTYRYHSSSVATTAHCYCSPPQLHDSIIVTICILWQCLPSHPFIHHFINFDIV